MGFGIAAIAPVGSIRENRGLVGTRSDGGLVVVPVENIDDETVAKRLGEGGLAAEFFLRVARAYDPAANAPRYKFNSSVAERVIDGWLEEKKVGVLRGKRISEEEGAVVKKDGRITGFRCGYG